jgi:type II secretory pathway predicted ATPase ExeA
MYQTAKNGGFIAVVGESGAGKSTLAARPHRSRQCARAADPLHPAARDRQEEAHRADDLRGDLGDLAPNERTPQSLERLSRKVEHVLTESYKAGNRHVLLIEEAQDLEPRALKHLKRFYELQAATRSSSRSSWSASRS